MADQISPKGRPPLPEDERRSVNLTFRWRGQLPELLHRAAERSGRTLSAEIEFRLAQSLLQDIGQ